LVPNLGQMRPAHIFQHYFPKIYSNIIISSMPTSHKWSLHVFKP